MFFKSFIITLCVSLTFSSFSQGYLKADGKRIINDKGQVLLRGMGLGGWMLQEPYMLQLSGIANNQQQIKNKIIDLIGQEKTKLFYDAWLANHCTKIDIDSLAAWGFNSVRLPMHYNLFTLSIEDEPVKGKNTWLAKGFALTDSLIKWCKANKMYVILDLHAAPGGQGNDIAISDRDPSKLSLWESDLNKQKTIALWQQLAKRYVNESWVGGYDLINETNWGFTDSTDKHGCAEKENIPLKNLLKDITTAIRKIDKKHMIFIEANCWANNYGGMFPLWDNNMAISFHKYWNYNDEGSIKGFTEMRNKYNVPVWMGESGENSNVWFTDAISLFEKNDIGWTWWPLKKLGGNNPFQIKQNDGYKNIVAYWKGETIKPSQSQAFSALMELAGNTNAKKNMYKKDVADAMIRQINSTQAVSFKPNIIKDNSIVYAVDYDLGRNGIAYADSDTADYHVATSKTIQWNQGYQYRNDAVDIETCIDSTTNGYNIGWTENGEWLQYTVNAKEEGWYNVNIRAASKYQQGSIQLSVNGTVAHKNIALPITGEYQAWQTVHAGDIKLKKGNNIINVYVEKGGFNLNYLQFTNVNSSVKNN